MKKILFIKKIEDKQKIFEILNNIKKIDIVKNKANQLFLTDKENNITYIFEGPAFFINQIYQKLTSSV